MIYYHFVSLKHEPLLLPLYDESDDDAILHLDFHFHNSYNPLFDPSPCEFLCVEIVSARGGWYLWENPVIYSERRKERAEEELKQLAARMMYKKNQFWNHRMRENENIINIKRERKVSSFCVPYDTNIEIFFTPIHSNRMIESFISFQRRCDMKFFKNDAKNWVFLSCELPNII